MHTRRGIVVAAMTTAVMGLALPTHAQVPTPMKHGKPVTEKQCKDGGGKAEYRPPTKGTSESFYCKGGAWDGDDIK